MKRLILLVAIAILCVANGFSQSVVMGMNIETTNTKHVAMMAKKGYRPIEKNKGMYVYKVTFADFKDCLFTVDFNTLKNDSITSVSIKFPHKSPDDDEWKVLFPLQRQLKEKYGAWSYKKEWWDGLSLHEPKVGSRTYTFENAPNIELKRYWELDKDGREIGKDTNYVILIYSTKAEKYTKTEPSSDL